MMPCKGKQRIVSFIPDEGFVVFIARIMHLFNNDEVWRDAKVTEGGAIFFKATKTARQADYHALSDDNFWELVQSRWAGLTESETTQLLQQSRTEGRAIAELFIFEFFYVCRAAEQAEGNYVSSYGVKNGACSR